MKQQSYSKRKERNRKTEPVFLAGMTLEACLVLPIFLFAVLSILSVMDMLRFSSAMEFELTNAAREIAAFAPVYDTLTGQEDEEAAKSIPRGILSAGYTRARLDQAFTKEDYQKAGVVGAEKGISDLYTYVLNDRDMVDLVYSYHVKPWINMSFYPGYFLINRCRVRAWTGYAPQENAEKEERYVYITKEGTVYHMTDTCSYLDLSIMPVYIGEIEDLRNRDGSRYKICRSCIRGKMEADDMVYITLYGEKYHRSLTCSGLIRNIKRVPLSSVQNRRVCSKCSKNADGKDGK